MTVDFAFIQILLAAFIFQSPVLIRADYSEDMMFLDLSGVQSTSHYYPSLWVAPPNMSESPSQLRSQYQIQPIESGPQKDLLRLPIKSEANLKTDGTSVPNFPTAVQVTHSNQSGSKAQQSSNNRVWDYQNWNFPFEKHAPNQIPTTTTVFNQRNNIVPAVKDNGKKAIETVSLTGCCVIKSFEMI
ncbi:hypothetical protein O181_058960 [Austropuccinia psidii MF-1]|uniref:Uncharacterized protein n=1 Tax=Austropuccinia psidii MF-1 TaxID=1389203 RepID=A0A9Q3EHJ5_9BASI|nr:hypothetical protein [Austropuccinia psidii MF-1]